MLWTSFTFQNVFQYQKSDLFWCTADLGWITGHSYMAYGPLLCGATQVIFEGVPNWPDAGRFWQVIDKYKVTHFYTAPTAIRALMAQDTSHVKKQNLKSLKVLGSVGEPINDEAWQWYYENIGQKRCPIVDTWWQTETGGIMISSLAGVTPSISTFATKPLPGVEPVLMSDDGVEGPLCIRKPWPGMARSIFGDHQRYLQTYFTTYPGFYFTGDGARVDENGNFRIIGRIDDVVNVSGHRIGTAEVEDAVNLHPAIVESAVIGVPHDIKGQGIVAFAICTEKNLVSEKVLSEVNLLIQKQIGAIAKLENIYLVTGLPKTRSGKIMRRILRKALEKDRQSLGDISTLVNPEVVEELFKL
jgi:acetyl-CoA synthetase